MTYLGSSKWRDFFQNEHHKNVHTTRRKLKYDGYKIQNSLSCHKICKTRAKKKLSEIPCQHVKAEILVE